VPDPTRTGARPELHDLLVPVTGLRPYQRNPRNGDTDLIVDSLRQNGQYRPIVVRDTGEVLAGNHTLAAALELGWTHIAATSVTVTDEQAARIVLVDNRANDRARYDDALLADLLTELPDLAGTGYDGDDLKKLLDGLDTAGDTPLGEDVLPTGDEEDVYRQQYGVIVIAATESEQQQVFERLSADGFNCRVVTT
jgi:ParB-like chromosome segregation protein Spo0J